VSWPSIIKTGGVYNWTGKETRFIFRIGFNERVKATLIFAFAGLLGMGCATPQSSPFATALNWVTQSREYKAVCLQTYANAWEKVVVAAQKESGPWAIVMDLDETVLDNSGYQRRLETSGEAYSQESWEKWVIEEKSGLVPGAKEFIAKVRKLPRARIIFISNRFARNTAHSLANVKKLGLGADNDIYLLRKDRIDLKSIRRKEVLTGTGRMKPHGAMKVLAWFGDAAHDHPDDPKMKWGTHKFMLPNPVYGNW
jgi:5'-nucleotidase (lipoprotein e(P4) family)